MQSVCGECGRTINSEFIFCPWCGFRRMKNGARILSQTNEGLRWVSQDGHKVTDASFGAHELSAAAEIEFDRAEQYKRITNMARVLDALEKDLAALALSEEMHK
jgi:hypothetical protein